MSDSPEVLAEQARGVRWRLGAVRRSPLLWVLLLAEFVVTPVLWAIWEPGQLVRTIVSCVILMPIWAMVSQLKEGRIRALEQADEAAERTGRRRPLSAPSAETNPATFDWHSPAGHHLILKAVVWTGLLAMFVWIFAKLVHDDPPQTTTTVLLAAAGSFLVLALFLAMAGVTVVGVHRKILGVLADPAERAVVEVIGLDPRNQVWVLQRVGTRSRVTVKLLGGKKLLVAGDTLLAQGAITKPAKNWRRSIQPMMALTGKFGTLWAYHHDAPDTSLSGTTTTAGAQHTPNDLPTDAAGTPAARTSATGTAGTPAARTSATDIAAARTSTAGTGAAHTSVTGTARTATIRTAARTAAAGPSTRPSRARAVTTLKPGVPTTTVSRAASGTDVAFGPGWVFGTSAAQPPGPGSVPSQPRNS